MLARSSNKIAAPGCATRRYCRRPHGAVIASPLPRRSNLHAGPTSTSPDLVRVVEHKPDVNLSVLKSISVPSRNRIADGSIRIARPCPRRPRRAGASAAYSIVYSMPAQPPFFTPTRKPATGVSARAMTPLCARRGVGQCITLGVGLTMFEPREVMADLMRPSRRPCAKRLDAGSSPAKTIR